MRVYNRGMGEKVTQFKTFTKTQDFKVLRNATIFLAVIAVTPIEYFGLVFGSVAGFAIGRAWDKRGL